MIERQNDANKRVVMVISTFGDVDSARQFGTTLIQSQLAACINLIPGATSIYQWQGKIEEESEVVALMKTTSEKLAALEAFLQENHPYDEPECIVISLEAGSKGYLDWVRTSVAVETPLDKPAS